MRLIDEPQSKKFALHVTSSWQPLKNSLAPRLSFGFSSLAVLQVTSNASDEKLNESLGPRLLKNTYTPIASYW